MADHVKDRDDKADDMADLTHLTEDAVVHNLQTRYQADMIHTYSGLFLVTVNPFCPLPIYTNDYINMYRGRGRQNGKPHIFAMADEAFRNLVDEGENQSILVTGESGAGKTENTKKVIQYLAAVAGSDALNIRAGGKAVSNLSQQILRANPILEAFGNAQTVRNNNSSRFGKFIRIEFTRAGKIAGAFIDWYLLEKSRVVKLNSNERNYHVFYQLLRGAERKLKQECLLDGMDVKDFAYTRDGNDSITGVSDHDEWNALLEAFHVMGFSQAEQSSLVRTVAAVLHLGNIKVVKESFRADQARLDPDAERQAAKVCRLLGIEVDDFIQGLLHPRVKAGNEWVEKVQTPDQVKLAIDALSKGIYERSFGDLVSRINRQLHRAEMGADDSHFIGVLDIAGFEIFRENSFEQLCINYTNEKLQQFFNHHMFVLEQEEYAREQIEWKFIDFGRDLQPTIDLIELSNPIGLFSCLDEDSVMPKATDKSFTEKLHDLWDRKTPKYRRSLLTQGFVLTHYAAEVDYTTDGWLEKNKDPLNDNITRLLSSSTDKHIATLFADCADVDDGVGSSRSRVKKGLFRTVAQRHKEQLMSLMNELHSTHPHFVRCIIPNHQKRPRQFNAPLVLDQLRCNGVLEGIRIARNGFPNRLPFSEFRQRYEVLCRNMPNGFMDGQRLAKIMIDELNLDSSDYRIGLTKVFFRAGVLADLEQKRDMLIREIMSRFQSLARGFTQRRIANKRLYRAEATRIIQRNFQIYLDLCENPWWRLFVKMKPLLAATGTSGEVKKRDEVIQKLQSKMQQEASERQRLEDDRRRADSEIQRVQQTLESERALALDKDEIFKRLQYREVELSEKLAGALDDQEGLEDQIDGLIDAKKRVEIQSETYRSQLEQAGNIIQKLEVERKELQDRESSLQSQLHGLQLARAKVQAQAEDAQYARSAKAEAEEQCNHLQAQVEAAAIVIQRLERGKNESGQREQRLQRQLDELQKTQSAKDEAEEQSEHYRIQLQHAGQTIRQLESERRSAQDSEGRLQTQLDQANGLNLELENERQSIMQRESQLQSQAADLKTDRSELNRLRTQAEDLTRHRKNSQDQEIRLKAQLDAANQRMRSLESERQQLQNRESQLLRQTESLQRDQSELSTLRSQLSASERTRKAAQASESDVRSDLAALRLELSTLQRSRAEKSDAHTSLEKAHSSTLSDLATLRSNLSSITRERDILRSREGDFQAALASQSENSAAHEAVQTQLQQASQIIASLEGERTAYHARETRLQAQLDAFNRTRSEKNAMHDGLAQEVDVLRANLDKVGRLLGTMDSLQTSDTENRGAAKRAEKELREEREKSLRLERELEGWKALRVERRNRGMSGGVNITGGLSEVGDGNVMRKPSYTKGFL